MSSTYYVGTPKIISLATSIGKLLGKINAVHLRKPSATLGRSNRILSIQSSLWIEGNPLTELQVSDIINDKRVLGTERDIREVKNAISVYDHLQKLTYDSMSSYLSAHKILMQGLVESAGTFRTQSVGVFQGEQNTHLAPPAWNVENLMKQLFDYLKTAEDNLLIKSCVFHYEMEFIHPFMDGNGRMGRLWQTVVLMQENPIFEYLPIEHEIKIEQQYYYNALSQSDKAGHCTAFVKYMLERIELSLQKLVPSQRVIVSDVERINYFTEHHLTDNFARRDYLDMFKDISSATASRDMRKGVEIGAWKKQGDNRNARYVIIRRP